MMYAILLFLIFASKTNVHLSLEILFSEET